MGCFYLSLPLHEVLLELHAAHPEVIIMAYIDDVLLTGPPAAVRAAYDDLERLMHERLGLRSQPSKCHVYSPQGDVSMFPQDMPGVLSGVDGVEVLGIPVGTDEFVRQHALDSVARLDSVISRLDLVGDPSLRCLLLRCCAHPRVTHLLRGIPPDLVAGGAQQHDEHIARALQSITPGVPLSERALGVARLSISLGSMGLLSAERVAPAAYLGSLALVWSPMSEACPLLRGLLERVDLPSVQAMRTAWTGSILPAITFLRRRVDEAGDAPLPPHVPTAESLPSPEELAVVTKPKAQKAYTTALLTRDWCRLADEAACVADRVWLYSLAHNSIASQYLLAIPRLAIFKMSAAQFVVALRHHLREPQPVALSVRNCGDCGAVMDDEASHYIHCRGGQGVGGGNWYTTLHVAVQLVVLHMLRAVYPGRDRVVMEDSNGAMTYSPLYQPDITVFNADGTGVYMMVEVTVLRTTAASHVVSAAEVVGAALERKQERKRADYGDVSPHQLSVFALDEYGMLSSDALRLLRKCAVIRGDRLDVERGLATWSARTFTSFWRQRLSVACARAKADIILRRAQSDWRLQ